MFMTKSRAPSSSAKKKERRIDNPKSKDFEYSANGRIVMWLLNDSGRSRYRISKDTGITEGALSRIASGDTSIEAVKFINAHILTQYGINLLFELNESKTKK